MKKKDLKINKLQISRETLKDLEPQGGALVSCGGSSCITCEKTLCEAA